MNSLAGLANVHLDDLTSLVARKNRVNKSMVMPYVDYTELLAEVFSLGCQPGQNLVSAGVALPQVAQAADRAGLQVTEQLGVSPFAADLDATLSGVGSTSDVIIVANPNRVTGAHLSIKELEEMARSVPDGLLIVDEYYNDFFGVSAASLLDKYTNLIILRSFTAAFSIISAEAGYVLGNSTTIATLRDAFEGKPFSLTVRKTILATLTADEAVRNRLKEVHDESLRLSTELGRIGIQSRICATDFILLRVADPAAAGNHLAAEKVYVENLDGYPQLGNYLRYQVQSPLTNERMLSAFRAMPATFWKMKKSDLRRTRMGQGTLRGTGQSEIQDDHTTRRPDSQPAQGGWLDRLKQASQHKDTKVVTTK